MASGGSTNHADGLQGGAELTAEEQYMLEMLRTPIEELMAPRDQNEVRNEDDDFLQGVLQDLIDQNLAMVATFRSSRSKRG